MVPHQFPSNKNCFSTFGAFFLCTCGKPSPNLAASPLLGGFIDPNAIEMLDFPSRGYISRNLYQRVHVHTNRLML